MGGQADAEESTEPEKEVAETQQEEEEGGGEEGGGEGEGSEASDEGKDSPKTEGEEEETTEEGEGGEGEAAEEEEEEEEPPKVTVDDVKTAPMDYRFPTTNQAKHCYTRYNEFHRCAAEKGEDDEACSKYQRYYRSLCPGEWVEKWNEQREEGTFAGRY